MRPIALCMISRGESGLRRAVESWAPVASQVYVVCDPKDTAGVARELHDLDFPHTIIEHPWPDDFSVQRQISFDAAPFDFIAWADSDDVLEGADKLRTWLDALPDDPARQVMLDYQYAPDLVQIRERILPKALGAWADTDGDPLEVHELWLSQNGKTVNMVYCPPEVARVVHQTQSETDEERTAKRARNRRLLEKHLRRRVQAGRTPDRRLVSHLVDQYLGDKDYVKALALATKLAPGEPHGWCRHRLYLQSARAHLGLGDLKTSLSCVSLALAENPRSAEARLAMIEVLSREGRLEDALFWFRETYERGLPLEADPIGHNPAILKPQWLLASHILYSLNDFEQACHYAMKAGDVGRVAVLTAELKRLQVADAARDAMDMADVEAAEPLGSNKARRRAFCQTLPRSVQDYPQVARWLLPDLPADKTSIAIFCGREGGGMTERWGPDSLSRGIGGSEEAVIRVASELAAKGAHVECYGPWPVDEIRDGVHYIYHAKHDPERPVDVAILWRYDGFASYFPHAKKRVLWAHDQLPPGLKFAGIDEIWCLSESHAGLTRQNHPDAPPIWVTRNGLGGGAMSNWSNQPPNRGKGFISSALSAWERMEKPGPFDTAADLPRIVNPEGGLYSEILPNCKTRHRVIWASSPDRGLDILLDMWPQVREEIPDATLEVYYGFPASYMRAEAGRPELRALRERIEGQLQALKDSGVSYFGMVGADRLHRAFAEAEVWAYPTHWPETSCITAMKAQALGCMPVTVPLTALAETVKWGRLLPLGGPTMQAAWDERDRACYVTALIGALKSTWADKAWDPALATAFGWDGVAQEWLEHIRSILDGSTGTTADAGRAVGVGPGVDGPGRPGGAGPDGPGAGALAPGTPAADTLESELAAVPARGPGAPEGC